MWLLDTARAELHQFHSLKDVKGGYAILSHTWGEHEQTFEEVQALKKECEAQGKNPRDFGPSKISECCKKAESEGYKWVWIDACCINKMSSTELSEAINSMFEWYAKSEVCYAYLVDVPSDTDLDGPDSAFRSSRWHTRGWTLQELIAPSVVVFLSSEWQPLGTRVALASLLSEITLVPERYLTHAEHHSKAGVAERMTWAARRRTTRVEDEAYCLMGIFNVNIPTIYGEGQRAFRRLQLEIMRTSMDTSLFAWGGMCRDDEPFHPMPYDDLIKTDMTSWGVYLLARSPRDFRHRIGRGTQYTPASTRSLQRYFPREWVKSTAKGAAGKHMGKQAPQGPFGSVELPRFKSTSYGVKCYFPIIEITDGPTIAVLLCETTQEHIGLLLYPSNDALQDQNHQRYNTGYLVMDSNDSIWYWRLISLGADLYNLQYNGQPVRAQWRDIYVVDGSPAHQDRLYGPDGSFINCLSHTPFRIPHWLLSRLHAMRFVLTCFDVYGVEGARVFKVLFKDITAYNQGFLLYLGECGNQPSAHPCHWAQAAPLQNGHDGLTVGEVHHDCTTDHVANWPRWSKEVGDAKKTVRISFTKCKREPWTTLVLHLELDGEEWTPLMANAHVSFPTREELGLSDPCIPPKSIATTRVTTPETRTVSLPRPPPTPTSPSRIPKPSHSRRALVASANNARSDVNQSNIPRPVDRPVAVGASSFEELGASPSTKSSSAARRVSVAPKPSARKPHKEREQGLGHINNKESRRKPSAEAPAIANVKSASKDPPTGTSVAPPNQPPPSSSPEPSAALAASSRARKDPPRKSDSPTGSSVAPPKQPLPSSSCEPSATSAASPRARKDVPRKSTRHKVEGV